MIATRLSKSKSKSKATTTRIENRLFPEERHPIYFDFQKGETLRNYLTDFASINMHHVHFLSSGNLFHLLHN